MQFALHPIQKALMQPALNEPPLFRHPFYWAAWLPRSLRLVWNDYRNQEARLINLYWNYVKRILPIDLLVHGLIRWRSRKIYACTRNGQKFAICSHEVKTDFQQPLEHCLLTAVWLWNLQMNKDRKRSFKLLECFRLLITRSRPDWLRQPSTRCFF